MKGQGFRPQIRLVRRPKRKLEMPEKIPDTPENLAKIIMKRPPKKNWRYLKRESDDD